MGRRKKAQREFEDKNHEVMTEYYDYLETMEGKTYDDLIKRFSKLIKKDPDFLDPYLIIYELCQGLEEYAIAEEILDKAFERAMDLITDREGIWPETLKWGLLENRHIIRTILNKAISLWKNKETEAALGLFRKLLKTNPGDNVGARDFILAIKMEMSYDAFEKKFNKGGYYDKDLSDWFNRNYKKFPDEFNWWEKAIEKLE